MSDRQENVVVTEGTADQEFTVNNSGSNLATNKNLVTVRTSEKCFMKELIGKWVTLLTLCCYFEDRIQNATPTAMDSFNTLIFKLAIRPTNEPSGRDATSIMANSERGEHVGITASFENVPEKTTHYMCSIRMMRLEVKFRTR